MASLAIVAMSKQRTVRGARTRSTVTGATSIAFGSSRQVTRDARRARLVLLESALLLCIKSQTARNLFLLGVIGSYTKSRLRIGVLRFALGVLGVLLSRFPVHGLSCHGLANRTQG